MTPERWSHIKEIIANALELETHEREAYVTSCAQDPFVISEVLRVVRLAEPGEHGLLDSPSWKPRDFLSRRKESIAVPPRFEVLREAGRGGMGVVFECYDRDRNLRVALKTLHRLSPLRLYSFKQEFRGLAGVTHPNLVSLYELLQEDSRYFLSMEFIEGVEFLEFVGPPGSARHAERLRAVLPQIVSGLSTIHAAGKLHRDLKPSNVMVTPGQRAVILDFGLVAQVARSRFGAPTGALQGGTASYMAPEQSNGFQTVASDWYSLGVMLFEALTGSLPSRGVEFDFDPSLPHDLVLICKGLLETDPSARIGAAQIFDLLGVPVAAESVSGATSVRLMGREPEVSALQGAFEKLSAGQPVVAQVCGNSGTGKTALAEHFLQTISASDQVLVLTGRCFEQEAVPYKALDGLVDQLSQLFLELPKDQMAAFLPVSASSLATVFPVLECVPAFREACLLRPAPVDPVELRRCASLAMRDMLARIGAAMRLVVWLDDLHWIDQESARLIAEVMASPGAPTMMLLCSYRSEGEAENPCLAFMTDALSRDRLEGLKLEVLPLNQEDSEQLAARMLGEAHTDPARALSIARSSGGLPFFIRELVYLARTVNAESVTIESMIWDRVMQLDAESQRLLFLVAVAGCPVEQRDLFAAAGSEARNPAVLNRLAGLGLTRSTGSLESDLVEAFHDRIRETIFTRLNEGETSRLHLDLATALERGGRGEPEALATHLEAAGEYRRAGVYFLRAADRAARAVAFERAILLYEKALLRADFSVELRKDVEVRLAESLANAGRSGEASSYYFQAAEHASPEQRFGVESIGAYHLCAAGRIDEGRDRFLQLLERAGRRPPKRRAHLIARIYWRALRLTVPESIQPAASPDPADLSKIDLFWYAGAGIGTSDMLYGYVFWQDSLLLALRTREPMRLIRALAFHATFAALTGRGRSKSVQRQLKLCRQLAEDIGSPAAARGALALTGAIHFYNLGDWPQALREYTRAEKILVEECRGLNWELSFARAGKLWTLLCSGDPAMLGREASSILEDALSRGDRFTATNAGALPLPYSMILLSDQPAAARQMIDRWLGEWTRYGFGLQHSCGFLARQWAFLYEGDLRNAHELLNRQWPDVERSGILQLPTSAALFWETRARVLAGLAKSESGYGRWRLLRDLNRTIRRLRRIDAVHAPAFVAHLEALLCGLVGDWRGAIDHMNRAVEVFERWEMKIHALAFRRKIGEWTDGEVGTAAIAEADRLMRALGIANPEAVTRMHTMEVKIPPRQPIGVR